MEQLCEGSGHKTTWLGILASVRCISKRGGPERRAVAWIKACSESSQGGLKSDRGKVDAMGRLLKVLEQMDEVKEIRTPDSVS